MTVGVRLVANASRGALRNALTRSAFRRHLHARKDLPYPVQGGLGEFLPPPALAAIGVEYQQGLLDRLNDEVRGTELENKSVAHTVINAAPFRDKTLAFNYASLALNNSFFLNNLAPTPAGSANHEKSISHGLMTAIRDSYLSLEELKSEFSAAALGMASSGYVWCVLDTTGQLGVVITQGPGTLLVRSRMHLPADKGPVVGEQVKEAPSSSSSSSYPRSSSPASGSSLSGSSPRSPSADLQTRWIRSSPFTAPDIYASESTLNTPSAFKPRTTKVEFLNQGKVLYPLFCVSMYEHAWLLAGYGIWGKEDWLKQFWSVLDWHKVSRSFEHHDAERLKAQ